MFYGGESNVPGAPGNLLAGAPSFDIRRSAGALGGRSGEQLRRLYEGGTQQNQQLNEELMKRGIMPGSGPQLPMAFGSSNLPGAAGNMAGMANAQFFDGPQLGQVAPHGSPQRMQPREYLDKNMPAYPPGYGPPSKQPQSQPPEPFNPTQLELPLAMRGLQVPPGFQNKFVS